MGLSARVRQGVVEVFCLPKNQHPNRERKSFQENPRFGLLFLPTNADSNQFIAPNLEFSRLACCSAGGLGKNTKVRWQWAVTSWLRCRNPRAGCARSPFGANANCIVNCIKPVRFQPTPSDSSLNKYSSFQQKPMFERGPEALKGLRESNQVGSSLTATSIFCANSTARSR